MALPTPTAFEGGFSNPVHDATNGFRAIMNAMARPGLVQDVVPLCNPPSLKKIAGMIALTLCDHDTPVFLHGDLGQSEDAMGWINFHCSAPLTREASEAAFVFLSSPKALPQIDQFAKGTQEYPDRSATCIVPVEGFETDPDWTLTGPGVNGSIAFRPIGVDDIFLPVWRENGRLFPRGVDLIFASEDQIAALPRTTKIHTHEVN